MRHLLMRLFLAMLLATAAGGALAGPRGDTSEWSLNLFVVGSNHYAFEGGASARSDTGAGFGFSVARNLNDYFAVGVEGSLATFSYRASIAPGSGNGGAGYETRGDMESATLRVHATWNLLARPLTPFVTAAAGVIFLEPDFGAQPPADACWAYPWYGEVCGARAPTSTLARFSYGAGAGLRFDFPGERGFIRAFVGGEWIEMPEAPSTLGYVTVRADFGLRF